LDNTPNPVIHQSEVSDESIDKMKTLIFKMGRIMRLLDEESARNCQVTVSQCLMLQLLADEKESGLAMKDLAQQMGMATSTITRFVDALVRDGYVIRKEDNQDRRINRVIPTQKGFDKILQLKEKQHNCLLSILNNIPQIEHKKTIDCMGSFLLALEGYLSKGCE
jgi:DNA-binding MarR family transcriptional regulator